MTIITNESVLAGGVSIAGNRNRSERSNLKIKGRLEFPQGSYVLNGKGNVIEKNQFSCEGDPGIAIPATTVIETLGISSDTTIKSNTIYACEIGINIEVPRTIIKDNRITSSSEVGIRSRLLSTRALAQGYLRVNTYVNASSHQQSLKEQSPNDLALGGHGRSSLHIPQHLSRP